MIREIYSMMNYTEYFTQKILKKIEEQIEKDISFCDIRLLSFGDSACFNDSNGNQVVVSWNKTITYNFNEPVAMSTIVNKFVEIIEDMIINHDGIYSIVSKPIKIVIRDFRILENWTNEIILGIGIIG